MSGDSHTNINTQSKQIKGLSHKQPIEGRWLQVKEIQVNQLRQTAERASRATGAKSGSLSSPPSPNFLFLSVSLSRYQLCSPSDKFLQVNGRITVGSFQTTSPNYPTQEELHSFPQYQFKHPGAELGGVQGGTGGNVQKK